MARYSYLESRRCFALCAQLQLQQWQRQLEQPQQRQQQQGFWSAFRKMMKSLFTFENLYKAYLDCRCNKRNSKAALAFEINAEAYLLYMTKSLQERTYHPLPSFCFVARNDKYREVFAANFADRIIHHLVVRYFEKIWEPIFIHDSYACRKNRGNLKAIERAQGFMRKISQNGTKRSWFMQLDIRSFFPSIDRNLLLQFVLSRLAPDNEEMHWLSKVIILHDPTKNAIFTCSKVKWKKVPPHKSLFQVPQGKGLPIGNLTSQFFANVYLNYLDQFIKHSLKVRYYIRYVDDLLILGDTSKQLSLWQQQISKFLEENLLLQLHPQRSVIRPLSNGINFLGFIVKSSHLLIRKRTVGRCCEAIAKQTKNMVQINEKKTVLSFSEEQYQKLRQTFQSYLGIYSHTSCKRLIISLHKRFPIIKHLFIFQNFTIAPKWVLPFRPRNLRQQYLFFRKRYSGRIIIQIGHYLELFDDDALWASEELGLKKICHRKRFVYRCGIPIKSKEILLLQMQEQNVMLILQTGKMGYIVAERIPVLIEYPNNR